MRFGAKKRYRTSPNRICCHLWCQNFQFYKYLCPTPWIERIFFSHNWDTICFVADVKIGVVFNYGESKEVAAGLTAGAGRWAPLETDWRLGGAVAVSDAGLCLTVTPDVVGAHSGRNGKNSGSRPVRTTQGANEEALEFVASTCQLQSKNGTSSVRN